MATVLARLAGHDLKRDFQTTVWANTILVTAKLCLADRHRVLYAHRDSLAQPVGQDDSDSHAQIEAVVGRDLDEPMAERAVDLWNGTILGSEEVNSPVGMDEVVQWFCVLYDLDRHRCNPRLEQVES